MCRTSRSFKISDQDLFKKQLLIWVKDKREIVFLDSNYQKEIYHQWDVVLAVDAFTSMVTDSVDAFKKLHEYQSITKDWLFGYVSYDAKNATENLTSSNYDGLKFPELFFFQPQRLIFVKDLQITFDYLNFCSDEIDFDFDEISKIQIKTTDYTYQAQQPIQARVSKQVYIEKVKTLQAHIQRGDIYEVNFCMEFFQPDRDLDVVPVFNHLNTISKAPFSVFLRNNKHYLLSASPERYLKKVGNKIISQPIKGTAPRHSDPILDAELKLNLSKDQKERSENIMITDLVRNDLSRTAKKGTVNVEELCEIYSFDQVHQMISTVVSEMDETLFNPVTAIESTFPMGSMTGAPKVSAMQLIEQLEETKRGLYSGTVGCFSPEGDFDFNVVIRSILYNAESKYVSFSVGSAITALSDPDQEYNECMLKAKAMMEVLG